MTLHWLNIGAMLCERNDVYSCINWTNIRPIWCVWNNMSVLCLPNDCMNKVLRTFAQNYPNMLGQWRVTLHLYLAPTLSSKRWANKLCHTKPTLARYRYDICLSGLCLISLWKRAWPFIKKKWVSFTKNALYQLWSKLASSSGENWSQELLSQS